MTTATSTLDEYLATYAPILAQQAAQACRPLHVPGTDDVATPALMRSPFEAQAHVITAGARALRRQKAIQIAAEMGTGKTFLSQGICQAHARGGYRALVMCPPHLCHKWEREIRETVENAHVHHLRTYHDLTKLQRNAPPFGRGWWIVSSTRAKMGPKWEPKAIRGAFPSWGTDKIKGCSPKLEGQGKETFTSWMQTANYFYCPSCGWALERKDAKLNEYVPIEWEDLQKKRTYCETCNEPLWQYNHDIDRWPIAHFIHKRLKGFFNYLVIDESHQTKSADTAIGQAMGSLVAACDKTICLTGTLFGGYAWHVRPLLFRMAPGSLVEEGLKWEDEMGFNARYGRLERKETTTEKHGKGKKGGGDNKQSKGRTTKTTKYVRPGIMPTLFGRHLIQNTIFLSLDEVAENLPALEERVIDVTMDAELAAAYLQVEEALTRAIKDMLAKKDKRMLSKMLHVLLGYADRPWDWGDIGYWSQNEDGSPCWEHVITPPSLRQDVVYPKEQQLINDILAEHKQGRQCWVYCTMTDKRDVTVRIKQQLEQYGLRGDILRSSVETSDREAWIAERAPGLDFCLSHPQLVETGLDLFDKRGSYNFSTLMFYQTGYSLFTLRQASRRAWRIGQPNLCKVMYYHYASTMQARAMTLMGKKLAASAALDGKFSSEGLAAMAGDEGTLELALARSLVERLADTDVGRTWQKLGANPLVPQEFAPIPTPAIAAKLEPQIETVPAKAPEKVVVTKPAAKKPFRQLTFF